MGDKISQLPAATTLTGTESVPVVQDSTTKKAAASLFKTTNAADITTGVFSSARLPVGNQVQPGALQIGTLAGQACDGADARLSNSRTPTGTAGGDLAGTYPNPSLSPTGVTAGIYGSATVVPQITVDSKGRVTNAGSAAIPIPQPSTSLPLPLGSPTIGASTNYSREDHVHQAPSTTLTGDVTGTGTGSLSTTLSNSGVTAGTFGNSSRIPIVTVDVKGRVTYATTVPVASAAGGTVTSVDGDGGGTGLSLTGGPITDSGTLSLGGTLNIANGGTGATVASDALAALGGIPLSFVGTSNGVASLGSNGLIPLSQLPNMVTGSYATLDGNGKVPLAQLYAGTSGGIATLDGAGKVPSGQLPSYVDDIVEVANFAALPNPGETGKIYVTLDTNLTYRWSGSAYVQVNSGPTPSSTTPLVAGTAAVGTSLTYARADHVHPAQSITLSGDFSGSGTTSIVGTLATTGVNALTYGSTSAIPVLTIDAKGRITAASTAAVAAISSIDGGSPSVAGGVMQQRRGTFAQWSSANPVLQSGVIGYETDTNLLKFGDGSSTWNTLPYLEVLSPSLNVDVLIVAGGGGGGYNWGGGGGAGGYRTTSSTISRGSSYTIVVGAGGAGQTTGVQPSSGNGTNSTAFSITSLGGGGGAGRNSTATSYNGAAGGSGGGCWGANSGGAGTSGQGNAGGVGAGSTQSAVCGGGGGAGAVGGSGVVGSYSGAGGAGQAWLNGVYYAGGGGGSYSVPSNGFASDPSPGGIGGGGQSGVGLNAPGNGAAGYGGGGGGGSVLEGSGVGVAGNGGSGVVIVRYLGSRRATGGIVSYSSGYTYHTFSSSGTFSLTPL